MATALTSIFGSEISVTPEAQRYMRQYAGFAGAHGVTAMHLGTRGRVIWITGRLRQTGATYAIARANLEYAIGLIEAWGNNPMADYTYGNVTYQDCVFDFSSGGLDIRGPFRQIQPVGALVQVACDFRARMVSLSGLFTVS